MSACPFCARISEGNVDAALPTGIFHFEPLNPVTPGHRLFVPREHLPQSRYSPALVGLTFNEATRFAASQGEDFNLIVNDGRAATQTVSHLHVHYVPRREGDGLTLPWTGQKR